MEFGLLLLIVIVFYVVTKYSFAIRRRKRRFYYRKIYLRSDAWKRKRYIVLKRDKWKCVYCGDKATQVHHKRYSKKKIGSEPIKWLVSVCDLCHDTIH